MSRVDALKAESKALYDKRAKATKKPAVKSIGTASKQPVKSGWSTVSGKKPAVAARSAGMSNSNQFAQAFSDDD